VVVQGGNAGTGGTVGNGGTVQITGGSAVGTPGAITVTGGASTAASVTAGSVTVAGGVGTSTNDQGGAVTVQGGDATAGGTGANGGALTLKSGAGAGTNGAGGTLNVTGGAGTGSSKGGDIQVTAGSSAGSANGGSVILTSGTSGTGLGGYIGLRGATITTSTTTGGVVIGQGPSTDASLVPLLVDNYNAYSDIASTCTASVNNGALYYNSASTSLRTCLNGAWEDVVSTAGLGIMLFGVVPDSGGDPGDLISANGTAHVSGPCKVSWTTATTVTVQPCTAYSGGRKVINSSTFVVTMNTTVANAWEHVCFNTSGALTATLAAGTSSETNTNNLPTFSIGSPVLCLADVLMTAAGTAIAGVYDVRAFTTSIKEFATASASAVGLGWIACPNGANVTTCGTTTQGADIVSGVVVASNMGTSTTTPNVILAVAGPTVAKPNTTGVVAGDFVQNFTVANRVTATNTTAATGVYGNLGVARNSSPGTACTTTASATNCDYTVYFMQTRR